MKKLKKALDIFRKYEQKISESEYAQITIDFVQDGEMELNVENVDKTDFDSLAFDAIISRMVYQITNILEIIKRGKDKTLFQSLHRDLEKL